MGKARLEIVGVLFLSPLGGRAKKQKVDIRISWTSKNKRLQIKRPGNWRNKKSPGRGERQSAIGNVWDTSDRWHNISTPDKRSKQPHRGKNSV